MIKLLLIFMPLAAHAGNFAADNFIANKSVEYFDPAASGYDVKMQAPALSSGWTLTLPTSAGSNLQCLQTNGSGVTTWASSTAGLTIGAFGSTPNADGLSFVDPTLTMQPADGTHPGGISATTQTLAGAKTFSGAATFSATGVASTPSIYASGVPYAGTDANSLGLLTLGTGTTTYASVEGSYAMVLAGTGFTGKLMDLEGPGGTPVLTVDYGGSANAAWPGVTIWNQAGSSTGGLNLCTTPSAAHYPSFNGQCTSFNQGSATFQLMADGAASGQYNLYGAQTNWATMYIGSSANAQFLAQFTQPTLLIQSQPAAGYVTNPTLGLMLHASQTGPLIQTYQANSTSPLGFEVDSTGAVIAVNVTDSALGAGVVTSSSGGLLGYESKVTSAQGGTGIDTSSSTGVPSISSGTWSVASTLAISLGGTNASTAAGAITNLMPSAVQGDIVYFNGTNWVVLAPGTSGYFLETQGASANPVWAAASGGGGGTTRFTLEGAIVHFTSINGPHYQQSTITLSTVYISCLNSGSAGSTTFQVNDYSGGSLSASATASLSASSGNPASSSASLSGSLSLTAGDVITVDVTANATGASDCALEY